MHKNFKGVEKTIFGRGSVAQLGDVLAERRQMPDDFIVFLVDQYFHSRQLAARLPVEPRDMLLFIDVDPYEPTTEQVDGLRDKILSEHGMPAAVVGIGGGSVMDLTKAVSLMLKQPGSSALYQGLNLVKNPGVYHIGVPTVSGTGAEVSMTAVLTGPEKKLGLKCDWTVFKQIILDPEVTETVPTAQWFYTGMDTYIHCIESKNGSLNNAYSHAFADQSLELCRSVFLPANGQRLPEHVDQLMVASMMGGLSLTYSEVGVCHALSYGLSKVLGWRHGYANCMAFWHLADYYPDGVAEFREMAARHGVALPQGVSREWTAEQIASMARVSYALAHMWRHALGERWQDTLSLSAIEDLFRRL